MSTGYGRDKITFKILVEYMKETHVVTGAVGERIIKKIYVLCGVD
jgi:hypothetical protein